MRPTRDIWRGRVSQCGNATTARTSGVISAQSKKSRQRRASGTGRLTARGPELDGPIAEIRGWMRWRSSIRDETLHGRISKMVLEGGRREKV
jgi:hypothetical protein